MDQHPETGLKLAWLLAGFAGGVASLSFLKGLTKLQSVLAVFTGAVTAHYLTPFALYYFGNRFETLDNGVAFILGVCAMNIIPGLLFMSDQMRRDPLGFLGRMRGGRSK